MKIKTKFEMNKNYSKIQKPLKSQLSNLIPLNHSSLSSQTSSL